MNLNSRDTREGKMRTLDVEVNELNYGPNRSSGKDEGIKSDM